MLINETPRERRKCEREEHKNAIKLHFTDLYLVHRLPIHPKMANNGVMRQYLFIKNNVTRTCTLLTFGAVDQTVFLPSQCDGCNFLLPNYMYKLVNLLICETELTVFFQLCYRQIKVTYQTVIRFMTFIPYFIVNPLQSHFNVEANSNQNFSLYTLFFL